MSLPAGTQLPPYQATAPSAYDVAWLAVVPTSAPALSADELAKVRAIRAGATEARVRDRAQAVLAANGTP